MTNDFLALATMLFVLDILVWFRGQTTLKTKRRFAEEGALLLINATEQSEEDATGKEVGDVGFMGLVVLWELF